MAAVSIVHIVPKWDNVSNGETVILAKEGQNFYILILWRKSKVN